MGKSVTVVVQGELGEELFRFEGIKNWDVVRGVLVANELGEDSGSAGVVLKEGWSFYSRTEIDDEFKEGDWVYAARYDETMKVVCTEYSSFTGEAVYVCQTHYRHNGEEWRTIRLGESEAIASGKPDYIEE